MDLAVTTYLNGISACVVFALGLLVAVRFSLLYADRKKSLMPLVILLGISAASFYLGPVVSFFSLLATGVNIPGVLYAWLSYSFVPVAVANAMYFGFTIFKPEWRKPVLWVYAVTGVMYWVALWGFPTLMIEAPAPLPGELVDVSFQSVVLGILVFDILSIVTILAGGFHKLRTRVKSEVERRKASFLCAGWILFGFSAVIEVTAPSQLIVVARVVMAVAGYCLYMGVLPARVATAPTIIATPATTSPAGTGDVKVISSDMVELEDVAEGRKSPEESR